jgi:hypothetical protein
MNDEIKIDRNDAEYEYIITKNAENKSPLVLLNFTREMIPFCHAIAHKYWYELKGIIPLKELGVCHFIPRNYDTSQIIIPDFFSGSPEGLL